MAESTIPNRTMFIRDNIEVLRGMNSESVDLIYLDPPFNKGRQYAAPVGSSAAGAEFKDAWTLDDMKEEWVEEIEEQNPALHHAIIAAGFTQGESTQGYLTYMAIRLLELRRALKSTGSIYLHCDPTASHYLKALMDAIFGDDNFRNEVIWNYGLGGSSQRMYSKKHDVLLFYTKTGDYYFKKPLVPATSNRMRGQLKGATDVWAIPSINNMAKERTGYPTQKPLALLERIVGASSNPNDLVFDPFCGCATACVAAEKLGREWIGIDIAPKAYELVVDRLAREVRVGSSEHPTLTGWNVIRRTDVPVRTDVGQRLRSRNIKATLYGQQAGYCNGCEEHFRIQNLEIDHIVPVSKGGQDMDANLQLLCGSCNRIKGKRLSSAELKATLRKRGYLMDR